MKKKIRKIVYPLLLLFTLYVISGMILAKKQRLIIYKPKTLASDFVFETPFSSKEFNIEVSPTERLNILYLYGDSARGQVLYFHDNSGNIQTHLSHLTSFLNKGYNVFILDYPGYGKSTGTPTEESLNESAKILYQLASEYRSADSTVFFGQGLGSAVAIYLATLHDCQAVVLVNPFYSLYAMARHYFPIYPVKKYLKDDFPVYHYLERTRAPVFIFQGKKDGIIPFSQGKKLSKFLYKKDRFIPLPKANHETIQAQNLYRSVMDSILNRSPER